MSSPRSLRFPFPSCALLLLIAACGGEGNINLPTRGGVTELDDNDSQSETDSDDLAPGGGADDFSDPGNGGGEPGGEVGGGGGGEGDGSGGSESGGGDGVGTEPGSPCEVNPSAPGCGDDDAPPQHRPIDGDQDGDTILDLHEADCALDSDFDGTPDCRDTDSDADGILDIVEAGDADPMTLPVDTDLDSIPDFLDLDSDDDGIPDNVEGSRDPDGDTFGNWVDSDADGDLLNDRIEGYTDVDHDGIGNFLDLDSDGDTLADQLEGDGDADGDGVPDFLDPDSDNDTIGDAIELDSDHDGDGTLDRFDADSDGDGIGDLAEAGDADLFTAPVDTDGDLVADYLDLDSDEDGIPDEVEGEDDVDSDRFGNWVDIDSDGDFIGDDVEATADADSDSTPNYLDFDSDGDGISDALEAGDEDLETPPRDKDDDLVPDYLDLDADDDGIPDAVEGASDPDGDEFGNWIDSDSDADGIRDAVEGVDDFDGDGLANYLDIDSDGDTISDRYESFGDSDEDGIPDRLELDSDNDGVSDLVEAGDADILTVPINTDGDSAPDYQDIDSDGDGFLDRLETGCPGSTERLLTDSDADTYSDLAEVAVGSDPCNPASDVYDLVEYFFVLPEGVEETAPLEFSTDVRQADVHFNMDTTGSMGGEITALQNGIRWTIIPSVDGVIEDAAFGVSSFRDFPVGSFGGYGDYPFRLDRSITTSPTAAQNGAAGLVAGGGADYREAGWESLYQIATAAGGVSWSGGSIGAFGSIGWRLNSLPIVVHITDAESHNNGDYSGYVSGAHSRSQAVSSLNGISARVIGVASGSPVRTELRALATDTDAVVPACAFNNACGTGMCCTGINGAAESPVGGKCPLVFNVDANGNGLSTRIVDAIEFLVTATTMEVTTRVVPDPGSLAEGLDTSCFITAIIPNHAVAPDTCAGTPSPADLYAPAGVDDSFVGVTPGTQVFFDVFAENDGCVEPADDPHAYRATIEVVGDGVTVLDSLEVTIIIPQRMPIQ